MEKIINQEFGGERPLYRAKDLYLENVKIHAGESALKETARISAYHCTFGADADLAFEYSTVNATVKGSITSVKNPRSGRIVADGYGQIILDANIKAPGDCQILTR